MKERVLDPLGLARTSFDGDASLDYPRARRGGGGLYSNVPDLLAFAEHLLGGPGPLARESLEAMATPQIAAPEGWYGLGIGLRDVGGRRILEHGGSVPGFKALFTIVPDCDLAFVALSSSDAGRKAIDRLRDRAFESGCGLVPQEPVRRPVDPAALAALTGSYDTHTFGVRLAPADGGLAVEIADADETVSAVAVPTGDSVFRVADGDEEGLLVELLEPGLVRVGGMVARRSG